MKHRISQEPFPEQYQTLNIKFISCAEWPAFYMKSKFRDFCANPANI